MKVLVACECSGVVRDAFLEKGHEAVSCDILPTDSPGPHFLSPIEDVLPEHPDENDWDLMIAFPPCTHLSVSGARWWPEKIADGRQEAAARFFRMLAEAPLPRSCVENPVGAMSTKYRKPDQIVHPFWFGDEARKQTCLWLKGLPKLQASNMVDMGEIHTTKSGRQLPKWYNIPPSNPDRAKLRSKTFPGFAKAMADQWGDLNG